MNMKRRTDWKEEELEQEEKEDIITYEFKEEIKENEDGSTTIKPTWTPRNITKEINETAKILKQSELQNTLDLLEEIGVLYTDKENK